MKIHRNIIILEQDLIIYRQVFEGAQTLRYVGNSKINLRLFGKKKCVVIAPKHMLSSKK